MTRQLSFSRRDFLKTSAGWIAAAGLSPSLLTAGKKKHIPVAVQVYSVRKDLENDFFKTLETIANIGYDGVEMWKFFGHSAKSVRKCMDDNGLKAAGAHTDLDTVMGENLAETVAFHQILGNDKLIIPWLPESMRNSKDAWLKTADLFNALADKLKPEGMRIGYHNHGMEFEPLEGEMPWDIFARSTSPDVILQFDTGNAAAKAGSPVPYLKKYPGRTATIHIKEYSAKNPQALIGEGNLPFPEIIEVCRTVGGTEWFIIEEEKDIYPPLEGIEKSLHNFRKLLGE